MSWLLRVNEKMFQGKSAFCSGEQRVAILHNHSPQKTVNFSNTIRSSEKQ